MSGVNSLSGGGGTALVGAVGIVANGGAITVGTNTTGGANNITLAYNPNGLTGLSFNDVPATGNVSLIATTGLSYTTDAFGVVSLNTFSPDTGVAEVACMTAQNLGGISPLAWQGSADLPPVSTVAYLPGAVIIYNSITYICRVAQPVDSEEPSEGDNWVSIGSGGGGTPNAIAGGTPPTTGIVEVLTDSGVVLATAPRINMASTGVEGGSLTIGGDTPFQTGLYVSQTQLLYNGVSVLGGGGGNSITGGSAGNVGTVSCDTTSGQINIIGTGTAEVQMKGENGILLELTGTDESKNIVINTALNDGKIIFEPGTGVSGGNIVVLPAGDVADGVVLYSTGAWRERAGYNVGSVVSYLGGSYECIQYVIPAPDPNPVNEPPTTATSNWQSIGGGGGSSFEITNAGTTLSIDDFGTLELTTTDIANNQNQINLRTTAPNVPGQDAGLIDINSALRVDLTATGTGGVRVLTKANDTVPPLFITPNQGSADYGAGGALFQCGDFSDTRGYGIGSVVQSEGVSFVSKVNIAPNSTPGENNLPIVRTDRWIPLSNPSKLSSTDGETTITASDTLGVALVAPLFSVDTSFQGAEGRLLFSPFNGTGFVVRDGANDDLFQVGTNGTVVANGRGNNTQFQANVGANNTGFMALATDSNGVASFEVEVGGGNPSTIFSSLVMEANNGSFARLQEVPGLAVYPGQLVYNALVSAGGGNPPTLTRILTVDTVNTYTTFPAGLVITPTSIHFNGRQL